MLEISEVAQETAGIQVVVVTPGELPVTVQATGVVTPDPSRVAHLRPLARGVVERVDVTLGDRVRAGQSLVQYDNVVLGDLIGEYRGAVASQREAEADLDVRRRYYDRAVELIEIEAIAQQTLELRRAELDSAEARVMRTQAEVARIEERIHRFGLTDDDLARILPDVGRSAEHLHREASFNVIRAPFEGIVTAYDVAEGEMVEPDRELVTITDMSTVWVLADIYEPDVGRIRPDAEVVIQTASYPDREFRGRVTYISDALEPATRTVRVRCVVPNADRALKLEMFATVNLPTWERATTLTVPVTAVQRVDGQPVLFVQTGPTTFERRDVELGLVAGEVAEVLGGLQPGVAIVSEGSFYLKTALLRDQIGDAH